MYKLYQEFNEFKVDLNKHFIELQEQKKTWVLSTHTTMVMNKMMKIIQDLNSNRDSAVAYPHILLPFPENN